MTAKYPNFQLVIPQSWEFPGFILESTKTTDAKGFQTYSYCANIYPCRSAKEWKKFMENYYLRNVVNGKDYVTRSGKYGYDFNFVVVRDVCAGLKAHCSCAVRYEYVPLEKVREVLEKNYGDLH